jgi:hypothetical protein
MLHRSGLFMLLFLVTGPARLFSQPDIKAVFTDSPPSIDGWVNEEIWNKAAIINELYQREPKNGEPVSEKTEFLFLFDKNNLYIGIHCISAPGGITSKEMARDVSLGDDDRVQVILDTYLDGRNGYWFQIGPRGSIGDALLSQNGKDFNKAWDGLWDGKAKITEEGWTAELRIPFKTLAFKRGQDTWGLKLIRHIKKKSESSYWPATSLDADRFQVSDAGRISGLTNITQGIGLDIIPYVTGGVSKNMDENPHSLLDAGLDAFYQLTPSLKAAVTVNTDFAQTEVDAKQINLTRFDLFFPEKRDFFLDGANYFNFGINGDAENPQNTQMIPFFSRRVGLDPEGDPVAVNYGGKFTGQAGKWNLGFIHIKDNNTWNNPGYTVGRITRNFGKQSSVGIIATNGNALSEADNTLMGIDLRLASAEIGNHKNLAFNLYGLKSYTGHLHGDDYSLGTEINYPNDFVNFRVGYLQIGSNFTSGLGFVPRNNIRNFYGNFRIGPRPKKSKILQLKSGISYSFITDLKSGGLQSAGVNLNFCEIDFLSGDIMMLSSEDQFESLQSDFVIVDEYTIPAGNYNFWNHSLQLYTAKRRNLWAGMRIGYGGFYSGDLTELTLQLGYKVIVPVYVGVESDRNYVNLPEGSFETQIYRANLNFLFSPNLSWYNFAQYDNQSETLGWQSRFQWIIKPGKEVYLTWNSPYIDPMNRFRAEIYEARVKVNYTIRF